MQPALQAFVGDGPDVLPDGGQPLDHVDQHRDDRVAVDLVLPLRPDEVLDLGGEGGEEVGGGLVVTPQPEGRGQHQLRHPARHVGGQLGGDHRSEGMADDGHAVEATVVQQVVVVEREVVDVAQVFELGQVGEAGGQGSEHLVTGGAKAGDDRVFVGDAGDAVQEDHRGHVATGA